MEKRRKGPIGGKVKAKVRMLEIAKNQTKQKLPIPHQHYLTNSNVTPQVQKLNIITSKTAVSMTNTAKYYILTPTVTELTIVQTNIATQVLNSWISVIADIIEAFHCTMH